MIEIKNLNKNFSQKKVLSDINLFIKKQEIFGLVGADGAGKTTLLRIILDLLKPESGFVKFAKNNLEEIHEYLVEVEKELGPLNVPNFRDSEIHYYNWLTWFMWEDLARRLWDYLEEDYDEEDYY